MEALAAVSLAGNILQFLNLTAAAFSKSRQIHASISGTLKEHDDLESLTNDLKDSSGRLQASAGSVDPVLKQLCSRCSEVAEELLKALESLGVKGKHTRAQSLRKALKAMWGNEKLKILEERLARFRHELTLHVNVEMRYIGSSLRTIWIQKTDGELLGLESTHWIFNKLGLSKLLTMLQRRAHTRS